MGVLGFGGLRFQGFGVLGFTVLGFGVLRFRGLGVWGLEGLWCVEILLGFGFLVTGFFVG